jgi:hypothetical protein
MPKKFDTVPKDLTDILKKVPVEELAGLRELLHTYQMSPIESEWVSARLESDYRIKEMEKIYGPLLGEFFRASIIRAAYHSRRFLEDDRCLEPCKDCFGFDIYCDKYKRKEDK